MTPTDVFALVEDAFPYVPRPDIAEISFHQDGCAHCAMSLQYLTEYTGSELPASAVRYLFDELSTLSPKATAWVLPSYLRQVLVDPEQMDSATEFLIYNLAPEAEFEEEAKVRLSLLDRRQVECLVALVDYWQQTERWGEYCPEELNRAKAFLQRQDA
jgi:hypothetical protein